MKVFWCDNCGQLVFFENSQCVACGCSLVFVPDVMEMRSFQSSGVNPESGEIDSPEEWRLCANYRVHDICNWAVPAGDDNPLCRSCRLTRVIPNLDVPENIVRNSAASMKRSRYAPRIENGIAVPTDNVVFLERVLIKVTSPETETSSGKAEEKAPEPEKAEPKDSEPSPPPANR